MEKIEIKINQTKERKKKGMMKKEKKRERRILQEKKAKIILEKEMNQMKIKGKIIPRIGRT